MTDRYRIEMLKKVNPKALEEITALIHQHKPEVQPVTLEHLNKIINSMTTFVFVAKNQADNIVGMVTLIVFPKLAGLNKALIEDLVVDKDYHRQGIGEALMRKALAKAKELGIKVISLTSQPSRVAANSLYLKLGFKKKETNYYRYEIK